MVRGILQIGVIAARHRRRGVNDQISFRRGIDPTPRYADKHVVLTAIRIKIPSQNDSSRKVCGDIGLCPSVILREKEIYDRGFIFKIKWKPASNPLI